MTTSNPSVSKKRVIGLGLVTGLVAALVLVLFLRLIGVEANSTIIGAVAGAVTAVVVPAAVKKR
jgi:hypothetical protein